MRQPQPAGWHLTTLALANTVARVGGKPARPGTIGRQQAATGSTPATAVWSLDLVGRTPAAAAMPRQPSQTLPSAYPTLNPLAVASRA
eukprot:8936286-Alexandrium_andersonii.AAC.1